VSCLHMLLGEMVPKNLALTGPERAAIMLTPALLIFVRMFRPIISGLTAVATGVLKLLRIKPISEIGDVIDRDSVAALIGESSEEGLLQTNQQELLSEALAFEETKAEVVGLPLEVLVTVAPDVTPADIEQLVTATGYSRFPYERPITQRPEPISSATSTWPTSWTPTRHPGTGRWTAAASALNRPGFSGGWVLPSAGLQMVWL